VALALVVMFVISTVTVDAVTVDSCQKACNRGGPAMHMICRRMGPQARRECMRFAGRGRRNKGKKDAKKDTDASQEDDSTDPQECLNWCTTTFGGEL